MKRKKMVVIFMTALFMLLFCLSGISGGVKAENKNNYQYFGSQLPSSAKKIYDGMCDMYRQGIFKTGTESYDLVENGCITKEELAAYEGNYESLLKDFGAARDAFYADYPDVFYVDFSKLSISVESSGEEYKSYLGTGDNPDYFLDGFSSKEQVENAISEQDAKVNGIIQGASGEASVREKVIYAHNAIIENTSYHLEGGGHIRTSYGALVKGESLCEGYARAVKSVLDSMGVTSVLVQGVYKDTDGSENLHMWNYVQIDGKWYGLDATANDGMNGGSGSDTYLLADGSVMGKHHIPNGVMSGAGFKFTYPQPEAGGSQGGEDSSEGGDGDSQDYKVLFEKDGLRVGYRDGTESEGEVGIFKVSYKGMGYQNAVEKEGVYILSRFYQYMPGTGKDEPGDWGYSDPAPFMIPQLPDALILPNGNSSYIEFAVTTIAPDGPLYGDDLTAEEIKHNWRFHGTESDFIVATGKLHNPKGNFVPGPFAVKLTPSATGFITCGKKYQVRAEFNEQLEEYDGQTAGYKLSVKDGWSAEANSKIENFHWDGDRTITFDFTPSQMVADSLAVYDFQITGLRGVGSLKDPGVFTYFAKKKISICAYRPQGYFWNVFGRPELLEPNDLSYNDWKLESGEKLVDVVTNVVLVASKPELVVSTPDKAQTQEMEDKIKEDLNGKTVLKSATYNIDIRICNQTVIHTGDSVRMSVGFPEGYDANTEDVVFKAYHFTKDKNGNITGVEEIGCVVTEYGLVIACKSFSPFAVVAVDAVDADREMSDVRRVLFLNSAGGVVEGEKIRQLKNSESQTVKVKAKDGYCLSSINLSGQEIPITDSKSMSIEIAYDNCLMMKILWT